MFDMHRTTTLGVLVAVLFSLHADAGECAAQQQTGSLTGAITNPEGQPVQGNSGLVATGVFINLEEHAKSIFSTRATSARAAYSTTSTTGAAACRAI